MISKPRTLIAANLNGVTVFPYILYSLVLILYLKCGGGGCNVFLTFYAISIYRKKNLGIQNNYFSFNVLFVFFFCMLEILKSAPSLTATG